MTPEMQAWLETRPECVKSLAQEFPPGTSLDVDGVVHYVVGYTENDMLLISRVDPYDDYDGACNQRIRICAKHFRTTHG
jgi:hypothetical protein